MGNHWSVCLSTCLSTFSIFSLDQIVNRAIADLKADSKTADCFIDIYLNGRLSGTNQHPCNTIL